MYAIGQSSSVVDRYIAMAEPEMDPLEFWPKHEDLLPQLADLARIELAKQVSSAASERLFSWTRLVDHHLRRSMRPEFFRIQAVILANREDYVSYCTTVPNK